MRAQLAQMVQNDERVGDLADLEVERRRLLLLGALAALAGHGAHDDDVRRGPMKRALRYGNRKMMREKREGGRARNERFMQSFGSNRPT